MAENLNYNVEGSKCYDNLEDNCETYGRLYDWATAMVFDAFCNLSSCSGQVQTKHRGICPEGWHIPNDEEWTTLAKFAGGTGDYGNEGSAGAKLKATESWNYYASQNRSGNGTDDYGFAALAGGAGNSNGGFGSVGIYGFWWSSFEYTSKAIYRRYMDYINEKVSRYSVDKVAFLSVRCLRN
jgi:uncharacterized protein (TIGR02145 family)